MQLVHLDADLKFAPKSAGLPELIETQTMDCPRGIVARICDPQPGHTTLSRFISTFLSDFSNGNHIILEKIQMYKKSFPGRY